MIHPRVTLVFAVATAVVAGVTGCGAAHSHVAAGVPVSSSTCAHAPQAHPASPAEIVQRFLSRLGDRRYVHAITFPPALNGHPLGNQLVAVVHDPIGDPGIFAASNREQTLTQNIASWEGGLVFGALRDDFCSAGGPSSLVRTTGGGRTRADVWSNFDQRFRNPSPSVFRARVARLGRRFGFHVVSLRLLHPEQMAPLLIVQTDRPRQAFADDVAKILSRLDPTNRVPGAFEGFFFAADDRHGPFLSTEDIRRGGKEHGGWACCYVLFPQTSSDAQVTQPYGRGVWNGQR